MAFFFPKIQDVDLPGERCGHMAVYWKGNIVIWGGFTDDFVEDWGVSVEKYHSNDELWMFDVECYTWRKLLTNGEMPPPLSGSCGACSEDCLYLFAGHSANGPTSKIYILNLKTLVWKDCTSTVNGEAPLPSYRDKLCCWQHDDMIIYFGGYGLPPNSYTQGSHSYGEFVYNTVDHFRDNRGWNNNIFILDTVHNKWIQKDIKGYGPSPRAAHAAAKLQSRAYVFGGRFMDKRLNDLYYLDIDSWTWSGSLVTTGCVPAGRTWHSLTRISDEHLLLYGGFNNDREPLDEATVYGPEPAKHLGISTRDAYILDTKDHCWSTINPSNDPYPRMWHTACATSMPGEVVIFGGCATSLLEESQPEHSNKVIVFRCTALPLKRLCTDVVLKYYPNNVQSKLDNDTVSLLKSIVPPARLKRLALT